VKQTWEDITGSALWQGVSRISKVAIKNNFVCVVTKFCGHGHMFLGVATIFCCCGIVVLFIEAFYFSIHMHVYVNSIRPYLMCFQQEKV
jgi:hypothetical protein